MNFIILFPGSTAILWTNVELIHLSLVFGSEAIPGLSFLWHNRVILWPYGTVQPELVLYEFNRLFCVQYQFFFLLGVHPQRQCLRLNEEQTILVYWGPNHFSTSWHSKTSLTVDQENSWFKPPHYLQACTADLSTHRWCCMQNNQLQIKSHVELQDNSKYLKITTTGSHITANLSWTNFRLGWNKNCKLDSVICKFHHWHSFRQVLYWLSGLSCNDENFIQKSGGQRAAAANGIALVCMDTSPSEFSHLQNLVWILNISVGQCERFVVPSPNRL